MNILPKVVRYELVFGSFWRQAAGCSDLPAEWKNVESDMTSKFHRTMIQAICDQDYRDVSRAANYLVLSTSGLFRPSNSVTHLKGFINAFGGFRRMANYGSTGAML